MSLVPIDRLFGSKLHDITQIHDHDTVAEMLDDPQIMGDKEVGQLVLFFDVLHQIDYLGLDRYIQGTDRLITDHELRMKGDRSRNAHTLSLAAGNSFQSFTLQTGSPI